MLKDFIHISVLIVGPLVLLNTYIQNNYLYKFMIYLNSSIDDCITEEEAIQKDKDCKILSKYTTHIINCNKIYAFHIAALLVVAHIIETFVSMLY